MTHPLVIQLKFARSEFQRCLEGVTANEAVHRVESMNCLSWMVGHLASQEHRLWVQLAQGKNISPDLNDLVGFGKPASTPPWDAMGKTWEAVTQAADEYLNKLTPEMMTKFLLWQGKPVREDIGTCLLRNIFHYWFHLGEAHGIRQMLGHKELPDFVGNMTDVTHSLDA